MTSGVPKQVAPSLFNYVRDYAIDVIEASKRKPVPEVPLGPLTVFVENFFAQFFRVALKMSISNFGSQAHERATGARLRLEKKQDRPEVVAIISSYETYCRIRPDIEQERSVPDDSEALDEIRSTLLEVFLPDLLARIKAWAQASGSQPIVDAVENAVDWLDSAKLELGYD